MHNRHENALDFARLNRFPELTGAASRLIGTPIQSARCHWSPFGADSKSSSTDARVGADGQSQITQGTSAAAKDEAVSTTGQSVASKDDGVSLGGSGTKNTLGSDQSAGQGIQNDRGVSLGGYSNRNILGGVELGGANTGTITIGDTKGVEVIADKFAETVEKISSSKPLDTGKTLEDLQDADEESKRERSSKSNALALWILGIVASVLIGWMFKKSKAK